MKSIKNIIKESVNNILNWIYFGIFIDKQSKQDILNLLQENNVPIPKDWKLINHHMTIAFNNKSDEAIQLFNLYADKFNSTESLTIDAIGISDDAIAVRVQYNEPIANKIPHITVAIPQNGKPVNSNYIKDWFPIENNLIVNGILKPFAKSK